MLVSYFCGYFLSVKQCDWRPTTLRTFLAIWWDSTTATFCVPQEELDTVYQSLHSELAVGSISFTSLQRVGG